MALPTLEEIQYQEAHIHDDRSRDIVIPHAICIAIAAIAVLLRFISRRMCKASIQADDWMILIAMMRIFLRSACKEVAYCQADS